ncbi:MAG TPA: alpha/beta hydrolase [Nocardioides sp.]
MSSSEHAVSADGTSIGYERFGGGRPLILVGGALRSPVATRSLAERLAGCLTVFVYDRRGRGGSGDTPQYAVDREIEDLGALIAEAGGTAAVYGHSSGAGLALRAAAHGLPITGIVLHDVPFAPDVSSRKEALELDDSIQALVAEQRLEEAVELFLASMELPTEVARHLSQDPQLTTIAHTIPYDFAVLDDSDSSFEALAARVDLPALVLSSTTSPEWTASMGRRIAEALPNGRHVLVESKEPIITPDEIAPVLEEFVTRDAVGSSG